MYAVKLGLGLLLGGIAVINEAGADPEFRELRASSSRGGDERLRWGRPPAAVRPRRMFYHEMPGAYKNAR